MKKIIIFCSFIFAVGFSLSAQSSKTNLSLRVSSAAAANRAQLAAYTWTRSVQVFIGGELKTTEVSSLAIGPDGKIVTTVFLPPLLPHCLAAFAETLPGRKLLK